MSQPVLRVLLRVYRRLPRLGRRWAVRIIAPSFTVGSMCIIQRDDGAILLVRHLYRRNWGVPGGLLSRGENAQEAARREVWEEVRLRLELVGEPAVVVDPEPQRVDIIFRARPAAGFDLDTIAPASAEILEARWFPEADLPVLQYETACGFRALARAARGHQDAVFDAAFARVEHRIDDLQRSDRAAEPPDRA
ncbi:MAG: NUDIX domain-containing protein [Acidimicrobiales bacterium]